MLVQNPHYAHMPLKFAARDGKPAYSGEGDSKGIFDVPDAWGTWLVSTPGWKAVAAPLRTPAVVKAWAAAAPPLPPQEPDDETTETGEDDDEGDDEGDEDLDDQAPSAEVDINAMGKNDLFALANKFGIDLSAEQRKLKVNDLREVVRAAIGAL